MNPFPRPTALTLLAPVLLAMICCHQSRAADDADESLLQRGEAIYRQACQHCHGETGQGVQDEYADPLAGDLAVGGLSELIAETMPEEDPQSCVGEDAEAVALYIHETFYSEAARVRNRPPRVSLARLTGEQLRQSLADLYGHFQSDPWTE